MQVGLPVALRAPAARPPRRFLAFAITATVYSNNIEDDTSIPENIRVRGRQLPGSCCGSCDPWHRRPEPAPRFPCTRYEAFDARCLQPCRPCRFPLQLYNEKYRHDVYALAWTCFALSFVSLPLALAIKK